MNYLHSYYYLMMIFLILFAILYYLYIILNFYSTTIPSYLITII